MRVTSDTFEYAEWPSRKPTKKKLQRESLKRDPLGTGSQIVAEAVKKSASRAVERETGKVARQLGGSAAVAAAATSARAVATAVAPAAAAFALVTGALYAMGKLAQARNVQLGERANAISREFARAQRAIIETYRVRTWEQVPADVRNKLVNGYKKQLGEVYSGVRPGVFAPSQQIPYGR